MYNVYYLLIQLFSDQMYSPSKSGERQGEKLKSRILETLNLLMHAASTGSVSPICGILIFLLAFLLTWNLVNKFLH